MGSGAALQPCVSYKKPNAEQQQLLRAFFASGEYASAMEGIMKDCPSPADMQRLAHAPPSADLASALEAFEAELCADAMMYDVPALGTSFGGFATADSLDSTATLSFPALPGSGTLASYASADDVTKPASLGPAASIDTEFTFGGAPLPPPRASGWAPVGGFTLSPGFDAEAQAVDVLALEREFSLVPGAALSPVREPVTEAVTEAGADGIVRSESNAAELATVDAVQAALAGLPTMAEAEGSLLTLCPTMWRDLSPPYRIQVNTGLRAIPAPANEAPRTFYGAINPRVITTGCPAKRSAARAHPYRRPPATRAASAVLPEIPPPREMADDKDKENASARAVLEEVWLLKRDAARPRAVADCLHCMGPFQGTLLPDAPEWPGAWFIDVVARVGLATGGRSVWLKAERRSVQTLDC